MKENDPWAGEPNMTSLYESYSLISSNPSQAIEELRSLARRGSLMSMMYLGDIYRRGTVRPKDLAEAERWLRSAAEGGSLLGLCELGSLLTEMGRYEEAETVFGRGVDRNYAPAMHRLAKLYLAQQTRVQEAKSLLERASRSGNLIAKRRLAGLLFSGRFGFIGVVRAIGLMFEALRDGAVLALRNPRSDRFR